MIYKLAFTSKEQHDSVRALMDNYDAWVELGEYDGLYLADTMCNENAALEPFQVFPKTPIHNFLGNVE